MKIILIVIIISFGFISGIKSMWNPAGEMTPGNTDWVYSMAASKDGDLYASSWARGIYRSTNDGAVWIFSGLTGNRVSHISVAPDGNIYALSKTQSNSYIHRSTDRGISWTDVYSGTFLLNYAGGGEIVYTADGSIVAAFAVTVGPTIGDVSTYVFKSTNGGNSFFQTQVIGLGFVGGMKVTSDNKILLGTSLGGVLRSTNNGSSFGSLTSFPSIFIKTIQIAPDNTIYVSDAYGLNRSTDNGLSFEDASVPDNSSSVRAAIVNSNGDVFLSKDDRKVFYSTDRGSSWMQINEGIPGTTYIYSFSSTHGRIYGGSSNSGVFYYDYLTGINSNLLTANEFRLDQNYPNPFNPVTNLKFGISKRGFVSLKVYNSLGLEVATLVNELKSAGFYEVKFDGSNSASGIYFYRLETEGFSDTKSMILLK